MSGSETIERPAGVRIGNIKSLLLAHLQQGLEPRHLALTLALGFTIGLIPSLWGASLICALLASRLGLNQVIIQAANYLVYPLQILLFVPYFKLGVVLFPFQALPENFMLLLTAEPLARAQQFWLVNLQALAAWLLTTPLLFGSSYRCFSAVLEGMKRKHGKMTPAATETLCPAVDSKSQGVLIRH